MESTQRKTAAPSNEPDADLLRLNTEYRALMGEIDARKHMDAKGDIFREATDRRDDLEGKIAATPAATFALTYRPLVLSPSPISPGPTSFAKS